MKPVDQYYETKQEPVKGCMLSLRKIILEYDQRITEAWKYSMPFFCFNGKMFCYIWINKKTGQPYVGFVEGRNIEHPDLIVEKRARMKILPIHPDKDIPLKKLRSILRLAVALYA